MGTFIRNCAKAAAKLAEETQGQLESAAVERDRVEEENERLRAALLVAVHECCNDYFWSGKAQVAADLLGVDVSEFGMDPAPANYKALA